MRLTGGWLAARPAAGCDAAPREPCHRTVGPSPSRPGSRKAAKVATRSRCGAAAGPSDPLTAPPRTASARDDQGAPRRDRKAGRAVRPLTGLPRASACVFRCPLFRMGDAARWSPCPLRLPGPVQARFGPGSVAVPSLRRGRPLRARPCRRRASGRAGSSGALDVAAAAPVLLPSFRLRRFPLRVRLPYLLSPDHPPKWTSVGSFGRPSSALPVSSPVRPPRRPDAGARVGPRASGSTARLLVRLSPAGRLSIPEVVPASRGPTAPARAADRPGPARTTGCRRRIGRPCGSAQLPFGGIAIAGPRAFSMIIWWIAALRSGLVR